MMVAALQSAPALAQAEAPVVEQAVPEAPTESAPEVVVETVEATAEPVDLVALQEQVAALQAASGGYVDNSLLFLVSGMVVMFMAAGFCMLEAGLVRAKNAAVQSLKNISLYSVAGVMFFLVGYNLLYPGDGWTVDGYLGAFSLWNHAPLDVQQESGYASASDWFFQMVFVATAASIVSGTVAERIKLWPFLVFVAVLTAFIYPIVASWEWGTGWLDRMGFSDFAGSTLVHSTGGWAALMGALILGPRLGKYGPGGKINPMPGSNIPLAALGTFILWLGWFGFNGGSQLALEGAENANAVSQIFVNTNMAAAAGVIASMIMCALLYKKVDVTLALNGAIGGLVSITAEPLAPTMLQALAIGAVGGILVVLTVPLLDKLKIDDVVGAIPAHLVCGIWGTLIVVWSNTEVPLIAQATGVAAIGGFVLVTSAIVWLLLKFTIGIRVSAEEEMDGLDRGECGLEAYPEFTGR
jgi:Amt family ammonium transporter